MITATVEIVIRMVFDEDKINFPESVTALLTEDDERIKTEIAERAKYRTRAPSMHHSGCTNQQTQLMHPLWYMTLKNGRKILARTYQW